MALVTPFWVKQRQIKLEEIGPELARLSGPNLKEAFLGIRKGSDGSFAAFMRWSADGPDVDTTDPVIESAYAAWEAAFEIYRKRAIV